MIFPDKQSLLSEVRIRRTKGQPIVFTNGCFDLLHPGHLHLLDEAGRMGYLIVAINSDTSVRRLKGPSRPIWSESHRAEVLSRMGYQVIVFDDDAPESLVSAIRPDVLVKGDDYLGRPIAGERYCGRLHIVNRIPNVSTSRLVAMIDQRMFSRNEATDSAVADYGPSVSAKE